MAADSASRVSYRRWLMCIGLALLLAPCYAAAAHADVSTFANPNPIVIPSTGTGVTPATTYPSQMSFGGVSGNTTKVRLRLENLTHTYPDDLDVLLTGPLGQKMISLSDAGGSADVNVDLTFDDAAPGLVPDNTQILSGTFKPTNHVAGDTFPAPAPGPPYAADLATFNNTDANGTWRLWVVDDFGPADGGTIAGGWSLEITTPNPSTPVQAPNAPAPARPAPRRGACANPQRGGRGRDVLNGTSSGDRLSGLGGNDRLVGRGGKDCLSGGSGNDGLSGGAGNDRLSGGSGRNGYSGGSGNDRINSRNGRAERVSCGSGRDTVSPDRSDRLSGCERGVIRSVGRRRR